MPRLCIANCSFEEELADGNDFLSLMQSSPIYRQLQFLPYLYADKTDEVFTLDTPSPGYLETLQALGLGQAQSWQNSQNLTIDCWGPTPSLKNFAKNHQLILEMPAYELIQTINSKAYSFSQGNPPKHSCLVDDLESITQWRKKHPIPFVLKKCFGLSGMGHKIVQPDSTQDISSWINLEFQKQRPLILEPWVERLQDFSTQWVLHQNGATEYLGATLCINDTKGHYQASLVDDTHPLFLSDHFQKHLSYAKKTLLNMQNLKFFGNVGFDTFTYQDSSGTHLHPIVEINARKTMGWIALKLHKGEHPTLIYLASSPNNPSDLNLLPNFCCAKTDKKITFSKNLYLSRGPIRK